MKWVFFGVVALWAFVQFSSALQCWECESEQYGRCGDYFNTTLYPKMVYNDFSYNQNRQADFPHLVDCESKNRQSPLYGTYVYQGRQVCLKRVETYKGSGKVKYVRGCHSLTTDEYVGKCPEKWNYNERELTFCEYCDTHECNGAMGVHKGLWMGLVPVTLALLRK